jgi:hypothetical protein
MEKILTTRKLTRGISKEFADSFKKSELYDLYEKHKAERKKYWW